MSSENSQDLLFIADSIHPLLYPAGAILMDVAQGTFSGIDYQGRALFELVNHVGEREKIHAAYIEQNAGDVPAQEVVRTVDERLGQLISSGIIAAGEKRPPRELNIVDPFSTTAEHQFPEAQFPERYSITVKERFLAFRLLQKVAWLNKRTFSHTTAAVSKVQNKASTEATHHEALHFKSVIEEAGRHSLRRVACLESTMATVLYGAAQGVKVDMQFGVAFDPIRFHAWPEAEGQPVRLPHDEQITDIFYPIYKV